MAQETSRDSACLVEGRHGIEELLDLARLRDLFEKFSRATGFPVGLVEYPSLRPLIATGWRDICTKFHRSCPAAAAACARSDADLFGRPALHGAMNVARCEHGLVDCATPIFVEGKQIAALGTGQVLLEAPDLDRFRQRARELGFEEDEYLAEVAKVPIVDEARLKEVASFLAEMAVVISQSSQAKLIWEREVADRKRAEASLRESEERYRTLFEGAVEGIMLGDLESKAILYANPSACDMFGFTCEEMLARSVFDLHPKDGLPKVLAAFEAQARGELTLAPELPCLRKDGSVFYADITTRPVVLGGRPVNLGFITNVDARRRDREERRSLREQLIIAQKMEAIGRLAGGVAHDFNNLLSVIVGSADLGLRRTAASDPLHRDLQHILKAGERAAALTRQLLAFSRKQPMHLESIDLNHIVSRMEVILRRTIREDIEFVSTLAPELGAVRADAGQIEQVIMNLAVNARDAMPHGGRLTIATAQAEIGESQAELLVGLEPGPCVILSVSDTGCGMDEETRSHLFEPFFTTKDPGKGTGLGLSTVYGIVKQFGGAISVRSEPSKGSTFEIFLPRAGEPARIRNEPLASFRPASGTETILVVEDDDGVRELSARILASAGYSVHTAANAGEALLVSEQLDGAIDLMLTDAVMPRMHGAALAERLSRLCPKMKVLFMSGYAEDGMLPRGVLEEGTSFIAKPFTAIELERKVREVLDRE